MKPTRQGYTGRLAIAAAMVLAVALLAGCASPGQDGRESGITAYGTLDVGISREK